MTKIIDFKIAKKKIEAKRISLATFKIPINYVDAQLLYNRLDEKRQNDEFLFYEDIEELFYELRDAVDSFDKKRVAWVVIDKDKDYFYLKENKKIYIAQKGVLEKELKNRIDEYAIDYIMFVERVKQGKYRKVIGW